MPMFIRVEVEERYIKYINVDLIRVVKPDPVKEDSYCVEYSIPGSPCTSKLYVDGKEISHFYRLDDIPQTERMK